MKKWTPLKKDWFEQYEEEMEFRYNNGELLPKIIMCLLALAFVGLAWFSIVIVFQLDKVIRP